VTESRELHDLAAAYALDSLDDTERRDFEQHLEDCTVCAQEIDSLRYAAGALAYAVESPAPPPELRARLLERVQAERPPNVVPMRRRRLLLPAVATVAAVAACAAIAFGVWAATLSSDLDRERQARSGAAQVINVLGSTDARRLEFAGQEGQLVVRPSGEAVLVVDGLPPAPAGKTYEAWVVPEGSAPLPAGIFDGGSDSVLVLDRPVPEGTKVAVSLEPAGGVEELSGPVLFGTRQTV
jgi:anti-sigma-K factor RskA